MCLRNRVTFVKSSVSNVVSLPVVTYTKDSHLGDLDGGYFDLHRVGWELSSLRYTTVKRAVKNGIIKG